MTWIDRTEFCSTFAELTEQLTQFARKPGKYAFRGTTRRWDNLQHSLYRKANNDGSQGPSFVSRNDLLILERHVCEQLATTLGGRYPLYSYPQLRGTKPSLVLLEFCQHFGAPTRLLDWTLSPWIAACFATLTDDAECGLIWWFDRDELYNNTEDERVKLGLTHPVRGLDLESHIFGESSSSLISCVSLSTPFGRKAKQQGMFTVAMQIDEDHAPLLSESLPDTGSEEHFGRLQIAGDLKRQMRSFLGTMNIHAESLDYPLADFVGGQIKADIAGVVANLGHLPS